MTAKNLICIDPATLQAWLACGDTALIDVRERTEYALEHIAGAHLMPMCNLDVSALPAAKRMVLCCASGNRSQTAARRLGLPGLAHLEGGIAAWKAAGFATAKNDPVRASSAERFQRLLQHA